jgi:membrane glycosyltransferase
MLFAPFLIAWTSLPLNRVLFAVPEDAAPLDVVTEYDSICDVWRLTWNDEHLMPKATSPDLTHATA